VGCIVFRLFHLTPSNSKFSLENLASDPKFDFIRNILNNEDDDDNDTCQTLYLMLNPPMQPQTLHAIMSLKLTFHFKAVLKNLTLCPLTSKAYLQNLLS
jgi:hypothetical protein